MGNQVTQARHKPMMQELKIDDFERARPLFDGFDYSLSIQASIEGNNPGRIFVDDAARPRTAFALTVEGYLLAGDHDNPATNEALGRLLKEKIFSGQVYVNGDWSMSLAVHPRAWESKLPELIPTHEIEKNKRYHYLCRELNFDWRESLKGIVPRPWVTMIRYSPFEMRTQTTITTWWPQPGHYWGMGRRRWNIYRPRPITAGLMLNGPKSKKSSVYCTGCQNGNRS
jgi:hypothetical protein